ncbi:MAG: hypothetical protein KatS3mg113_1092 [Planctomycetaceae bacterium]|nr:MAG: hypothetical protein KatS3mg113_1092 [Planctomycetaceae bacterium]
MSSYARFRDWHLWMGLLALLPMMVIAITGLLWNHEKTLGLKRTEAINPGDKKEYKPVRQGEERAAEPHPPLPEQVLQSQANDEVMAAYAQALAAACQAARDYWPTTIALERIEFRGGPEELWVKLKAAVEQPGVPYELVWSSRSAQIVEVKGGKQPGQAGYNWAKLVHDLHTGRFFSRQYGYLWSDTAALAILGLGMTGVVLYVIPFWKRHRKRQHASMVHATRDKLARQPVAAQPSDTFEVSPT